jgi:tetratricopeptide (TPR) repeat protein
MKRLASLLLMLPLLAMRLPAQDARVLEVENIVQTARGGDTTWQAAKKDDSLAIRDRIRTRQRSRATVKLSDLYTLRMDAFTTIEITPQVLGAGKGRLDLKGGAAFIFSREQQGEIDIHTPAANGALRGTQLLVRVSDDGRSRFQVLEGSVDLENPQGKLTLTAGEAGEAAPGAAPKRTAALVARNILQWALYYPGVLDPSEIAMGAAEESAVAESLAAYRAGDPLGALERYPQRAAGNDGGRLYQATVLLAVGRVDEAEAVLEAVQPAHPGRRSLARLIATVKLRQQEPWPLESLDTAGEAIAESYYSQSQADLEKAKAAARRATELAPGNGYAWTRLAELEFSMANTKGTRVALDNALALTPRNAQAWALKGFVHAAENRTEEARACFEHAIQLDGALGNGWLGLGLVKIKRGDVAGGRADLQTAATVEPTSSMFHSYLGKALSMEDRPADARKDFDLARSLDPNDPTPWLYSAIELQQHNRTNAAIADLQESILRNDNRRIYRSSFLLDQDRAVRSANLAKIYQAAGMKEVAVREATRAVESDYTNPSAHLFLANSFDALRDPSRVSLRYETPWFNELLLANLLSPVGGGPLSQFVSQQEYSKLLESDRLGGSITTEWRSDSEVRAAASLFGTYGKVSFGVDAYYRDDTGDRPNSAFTLEELYGQLKWQPGPDDIFYFLGKWQDQDGQDNFQTYDNQPLAPRVDFQENQEPGLLLAGWNHRWAPGSHTLFLAGRLAARQRLLDPASRQLLIERNGNALRPGFVQDNGFGFDEFTDPELRALYPNGIGESSPGVPFYSQELLRAIAPFLGDGEILNVRDAPFRFDSVREFDILSAEIQQVLQTERHTLLAGARWQDGEFRTRARLTLDRDDPDGQFAGGFPTPASDQYSTVDFQRASLYAYDYWQATRCLTLVGGLAWDHIEHPDNFRNPPVNDLQQEEDGLSGKLGFTWLPASAITVRGAYAQGLGGVTFDESVRLEPVQIAGFNQSYRTVISESLAGSVECPEFETFGLSIEGSLPTRTWWGANVSVIEQEVDRTLGIFTGYDLGVFPVSPSYFPDDTAQTLDYREQSAALTVNQLLGDEFAVGAGYRFIRSELQTTLPELLGDGLALASVKDRATLHEIALHADWNSPTGLFARVEANWYSQDLDDDPRSGGPPRNGDAFWQFNAFAGYRFNDNLCEVSAGILNIGDSGYHLSPLTPHADLVQRQTAIVGCRLSF